MRIVIDFQGAQSSGSRNRGIGRYSTSLTKGIIKNAPNHEIILILNGMFPDTLDPIRAEFAGLLPDDRIKVWKIAGHVDFLNEANSWRRQAAELTREAFIESLKPDFVLLTSLFEGSGDDSVTSIGLFNASTRVAVVLYDLIPYINPKPYLENAGVSRWYLNKIDNLRRAKLLLSISESSRTEALDYLGRTEQDVINISTATDPQFVRTPFTDAKLAEVKSRHGIRDGFVMYTGGIDHRKNIEGLIRAYALLPKAIRAKYQLAIVCSVHANTKEHLLWYSRDLGCDESDVIFTGYISEDDLVALYHACSLFVFPSWHEGFGLPALEAMNCGAPVIASNRSSLPEVVGLEEALFDPFNDKDISEKIIRGLTDKSFRDRLIKHSEKQIHEFSWDKTAILAVKALEEYVSAETPVPPVEVTSAAIRPTLAYLSPLQSASSGIAEYSAELLPELARYYDITVILHQSEPLTDTYVWANFQFKSAEWFEKNSDQFDRILYHFGNSSYHMHMFDLMQKAPGVMVLHDFYLSGAQAHREYIDPSSYAWVQELYYSHGYAAVKERFDDPKIWNTIYKYPCNYSVINRAVGTIVHSEYARRLSRKWHPTPISDSWKVIPHLRVPEVRTDRQAAREALGFKPGDYVICSFGIVAETKLNDQALTAFINSGAAKDKNVHLVFVGDAPGPFGETLIEKISASKYAKRINITGWVDNIVYKQYLAAADCAIQLRTKSRGETSGTVLDCMNYRIPAIVNANGSLADISDQVVFKLPDDFATQALTAAIDTLWESPDMRADIGRRAGQAIRTDHWPGICAQMYAEAIEGFYEDNATSVDALLDRLIKVEGEARPADIEVLSNCIARFNYDTRRASYLLLDITGLTTRTATGRKLALAQALLTNLLAADISDFRVEPVYFDVTRNAWRFARQHTLEHMGCPRSALEDETVNYSDGDVFIGIGTRAEMAAVQAASLAEMAQFGVKTFFVLDDLLSLDTQQTYNAHELGDAGDWLKLVFSGYGVICTTAYLADKVYTWAKTDNRSRFTPLRIESLDLPDDTAVGLRQLSRKTIEKLVGLVAGGVWKAHWTADDAIRFRPVTGRATLESLM